MKNTLVIFLTVILFGCVALTTSSGVLQVGKDNYTLSVQSDSAASAKQSAIGEANKYCSSKGKSIEVQQMRPSSDALGWHSYEVNFKCNN